MTKKQSLSSLVLAYFESRPFVELDHNDWVDEIMAEYEEIHGRVPRDPWRAARKLHQDGYLRKIRNGVYMYDPNLVYDTKLEPFTPQQRQAILERDKFTCVYCGKGEREGYDLHVDHIRARDRGGRAIIDNGQTLCSQHNFLKKNLNATESGKRMFMRLYTLSKREGEEHLEEFAAEVLSVFEKYDINGQIEWER